MAKQQKIEDIIKTVLEAGKAAAQSEAKDAYKTTERRLYALPILREKVKEDKERLTDIDTFGIPQRSKSIVRFNRSGSRLSIDDIEAAIKQDLAATIAADEYEIKRVENALKSVKDDPYYTAVTEKYIEGKSDEEVAERIVCDPSTVRRNRSRLVKKIAVKLYGAKAVQ